MQSIKSNALEPTRTELAGLSRGQRIIRVLPVYGLPILTILLIVGREPSQVFRRAIKREGVARLVLDAVEVGDVGPVDCEIRAGEVDGLVGLRGAG